MPGLGVRVVVVVDELDLGQVDAVVVRLEDLLELKRGQERSVRQEAVMATTICHPSILPGFLLFATPSLYQIKGDGIEVFQIVVASAIF